MIRDDTPPLPATARGTQIALVFALVAERLTTFYEHGQWLTEAQGASLTGEWLNRTKRSLPLADRKRLSAVSDGLARKIAASLSREAGLLTAHEMQESLDANYVSEIGDTLMQECERALDSEDAA